MPVATDFGMRSFEAFDLLPSTFTANYALWRNTEGEGTTVVNRGNIGTGDITLAGADVADIWSASNLLFGDASLSFPGDASKDIYGQVTDTSIVSLGGKTKFTVLGWIRPDGDGEDAGGQGHWISDTGQMRMLTTSSSTLRVEITTVGTGAAFVDSTAFFDFGDPSWWFVALVYDNGTATLYRAKDTDAATVVDANFPSASWLTGDRSVVANAGDIFIGDFNASGGFQFDGLIGEILFVTDKAFTASQVDDVFTRPWMYFNNRTGRYQAPWGDGLRTNVVRQRTADGDSIGLEIAPSVAELRREWETMNDTDRRAFYLYFRDVLQGGAKLFYLLDTLDHDADTSRKVRLLNNPFDNFALRRQNASPLIMDMVEV